MCQPTLTGVTWLQLCTLCMCVSVCACGYMLEAVLLQQNEDKSEHSYMVHLSWQSVLHNRVQLKEQHQWNRRKISPKNVRLFVSSHQ